MKGHGFSVSVGCLVWAFVPLIALGLWNFARGQGWRYSRFGWNIAADEGRASMADDYLATRDPRGKTLDELRSDLGEESSFRESWSYVVSDYQPLLGPDGVNTLYWQQRMVCRFSREGVLKDIGSIWPIESPRVPFDAASWQSTDHCQRAAMALDLCETQQLKGMPKEHVLGSLGPPDAGEIAIGYRVGSGRYLEIKAELDGRVREAVINRDD